MKNQMMRLPESLNLGELRGQLLRFVGSAGFSASISLGLPVLLHESLHVGKETAVAIGFVTAYIGNLLILRFFVFRSRGSWLGQVSRYVPINGAFRIMEYLGFLGLFQYVGLDYRVSVIVALAVSFTFKFFVYRRIFADAKICAASRR